MAVARGIADQTVKVNAGEVRGVFIDENREVLWVETKDGPIFKQAYFSAFVFLIPALLPIIGFVVPWAMMKGVTWVLLGFLGYSRQ